MSKIIETVRNGQYTGHYRLVGIPGGYLDLPGRGGPVTQAAARRAIQAFEAGCTNAQAQAAAWRRTTKLQRRR